MEATTLADFMRGRPEVVNAHTEDLADAVAVADQFIPLHIEALEQIRVHANTNGVDDAALILLGTHHLNLYTSTLGLALAGKFDVAWHLTRATFDGRSLTYAIAKHPELADRFLKGDYKGSDARKFTVEDLGVTGYGDIADGLGERWKRNADVPNDFSHVSANHLGALMSVDDDGSVRPHYAGHYNTRSCLLLFASEHEEELWFLTNLKHLRGDALSESWSTRFAEAGIRFGQFRQTHEHLWKGATNGTEVVGTAQ